MKTTTTTLALSALLALTLAAHAAEKPGALPEKPVSREQLSPEALKAFAAPLEAAVTRNALTAEAPPPLSFVSGMNGFHDMNAINHDQGGFEPMAFRPKLRALATDPDRVVLDERHSWSFNEGFYDGARVRVYQAIDGKLVKIRDAKVKPGGHGATGWLETRYQVTTLKDKTTFKIALDSSFLPDREYWFCVKALDDFYQFSEPSNVVSARSGAAKGQTEPEACPPWRRFENKAADTPAPPPAPKNLRVTQEGDVLNLAWDPVQSERLHGYKLFVSSVPPEKHKGFGFDLATREPRPDRPIQKDDIVFVDQFKTSLTPADVSPYVNWPALRRARSPFWGVFIQAPYQLWSDGADGYPARWELVPHPGPLPVEFTGRGQTCLKWSVASDAVTGFPISPYGGTKDAWYPTLAPGEYTVEAWVRGSGKAQVVFVGRPFASSGVKLPYNQNPHPADAAQSIPPVELPLAGQWTKVTGKFKVPTMPEACHGYLLLSFQGPGELYLDNLKIYRAGEPYGAYPPLTLQRIKESDMRFMRTHELIKTFWGYGLDGMTGYAGGNNYSAGNSHTQTFFSLLDNMRRAGNISPWLQVEMCLAEEEWLGFAEWMCAPYDPKKGDTPTKKPWAYKRWSMGQQKPWIDEFPEFAFEISNETWNQSFAPYDWDWGRTMTDGAHGAQYSYGATYGLFNEYVIGVLRSSPYWTPAVEKKTKFMLCGWTAAQAFGAEAAQHSPSADEVTYAAYVHNAGLGDPKVMTDFKRFYVMQWPLSGIEPQFTRCQATERRLRSEGFKTASGMYEYGYAYFVMPADPVAAKDVDQQLARSMIGAVAILDAALTNVRFGMRDQAFFTFGHTIGAWGSHTKLVFGGHAYPFWKALTLFNQFGGLPLGIEHFNVPRWSFPAYKTEDNMHEVTRAALPDAPLVSVHAYAKDDRVTVFLISRKLDNFPVTGDSGYTPATVKLPFTSAKKITLHKLAGDPRTDDRFEELHKVQTVALDPKGFNGTLTVNAGTGADPRGLPPASIFCYVFEGADLGAIDLPPVARFELPKVIVAGEPATLKGTPGKGLTHAWKLGAAGDSAVVDPTVTFPEAGMTEIALTVTNAKGHADTLKRANYPVGVRFGGEVWKPWSGKGVRARIEAGGKLAVIGTAPAFAPNSVMRAASRFGQDFTVEATVAEVKGNGKDPRIVGGLVLVSNPRTGLGFAFEDYEQLETAASVFVSPDGAVRKLKGQLDELLPAGSVAFPAKLRLAVKKGQATASVEIGGAWKEVAQFALPDNIGLMPALVAGSPGNQETTLIVTAAKVTNQDTKTK